MNFKAIDNILEKYNHHHSDIIGILQEVQHIENFLPEGTLRYISRKMEISLTKIFDIVSFYKAFSLKPRGRHIIKACCGTACHLGGALQNLDQIQRILNIKEGETTADRMFSLETVNCLGACALAPVVVVGDEYHEAMNVGKMEKIIVACRQEEGDS